VKLHDGELDIDEPLVRSLLAAQFPRWAGLPLRPVPTAGTEHMLYRLGDDLVVRLPRLSGAGLDEQHRWLPWLAPQLPLAIPAPVGLGRPAPGYPLQWAVYRWLDGDHEIGDLRQAAVDLGGFLAQLWRIDPAGAPPAYRGGSCASWDEEVRNALRDLDAPGAASIWAAALELPAWDRPPVWVHSDLLPTNLLARHGRLHAVIDFGCAGIGDPACDLMPAWALFDAASRPVFREQVDVDDLTWARGRAWALAFGLAAWHYYPVRDPSFAALGRQTVNQVLTEAGSST
jgi:aminoglycoside phosphotransferase (APT) family kinase protein